MYNVSFFLPKDSVQKLITPRWHYQSVIQASNTEDVTNDGIAEEYFEFESDLTFSVTVQVGDEKTVLKAVRLDEAFDNVLGIVSSRVEPREAIIQAIYAMCQAMPNGFEKEYGGLKEKLKALNEQVYWLLALLDSEEKGDNDVCVSG